MNTKRNIRALWVSVGALSLSTLVLPAAAATSTAVEPSAVRLRIISFNDFHGALDMDRGDDPSTGIDEDAQEATVAEFATAIEHARAQVGEANSILLSAGDSIGSSPFVSAIYEDAPTIELLNALDVGASALGNHELDRGYTWFTTNVVSGGSPGVPRAEFPFLAANVAHLDGSPAVQPFTVANVAGLRLCVVGAVTAETPNIVPPPLGAIKITDPVNAVNRVVADLEAADSCDSTVAVFHEGGGLGAESSLAEQYVARPVFKRIAEGLDRHVDAVVTAHTHRQYSYLVPRADASPLPVVQSGSFARAVGVIDLTIDPSTGAVLNTAAEIRSATGIEDFSFPRVSAASQVAMKARERAGELGGKRVGSLVAPITRAWTDGGYVRGRHGAGDLVDASGESTAGHVVADAMFEADVLTPLGRPDLGMLPETSVRSDLVYDGDLRYRDAYALFPDESRVIHVSLTGEQLRAVVEQQWRTDPAATSRLAVSSNVQIKTDPSAPLGQRVVGILLDGKPVAPDERYVVATDSWLGRGWGGFTSMRVGVPMYPGMSGRTLFLDHYLADRPRLNPDFGARQVAAQLPLGITRGQAVSGAVSGLDLTSTGSPRNTQLKTFLSTAKRNMQIDTSRVVAGASAVSAVAPANGNLVVIAYPSRTLIGVPLAKWRTRIARRATIEFARESAVPVQVLSDYRARGMVKLRHQGAKWRRAPVLDGLAQVPYPRRHLRPGLHHLRVSYPGDGDHARSKGVLRLRVRKLQPGLTLATQRISGTRRALVTVDTDELVRASGTVVVRWNRGSAQLRLTRGRAVLPGTLRQLRSVGRIRLRYSGSELLAAVTRTVRMKRH